MRVGTTPIFEIRYAGISAKIESDLSFEEFVGQLRSKPWYFFADEKIAVRTESINSVKEVTEKKA